MPRIFSNGRMDMTTKSLITKMPDYFKHGLGVLICSCCFLFAIPNLNAFIDPLSLAFIAFSAFVPALWLQYRLGFPLSRSLLILATPCGLIGALVGVRSITIDIAPGDLNTGGNAATMVSVIFYGIILTFYALTLGKEQTGSVKGATLASILPACILGSLSISYVIYTQSLRGVPFDIFVSSKVLAVYLGIFSLVMTGNSRKGLASKLADISIAGIMICIVMALILWFSSLPINTIPANATAFATLGLLYGVLLFVASFYVSLLTGETDDINFDIKNWHLIESAALYILLVFAPPSIFEIAM